MSRAKRRAGATTGNAGRVAELRSLLLAGQRLRHAIADHYDLSLSEAVALGHLADAGGALGPGELGERMLTGSGTLTAVVDRLVRGGYAERRAHPDDRRRVLVALTPSGRRVIRHVDRLMRRALDRAAGAADPPPLAPLVASLDAEAERIRATPARRGPGGSGHD